MLNGSNSSSSHSGRQLSSSVMALSVIVVIVIGWGQLPLSLEAKLNQTVLTYEFSVLNVYLLV